MKGRVISACRLFPGTVRPIGLALTGLLLQQFGAVPTALISWGYILVLSILITFSTHIREAGR
ncbi:MAG TPA: hypothetical protein VKV20_02865 [Ktedonobacteraceae bacterium]|nr:hypothetical protein [Ktedonobacteraceae bacterium]